jgi:hypothetical protein
MNHETTVDDLYPSRYLKVSDLPEEGDLILTITNVDTQEVGVDQDRKVVVSFAETEKKLVLNKTNATTISDLYGKKIAGWVGKKIALFATEVAFQGKTQPGIRIRMRVPQPKKIPAPVQAEPEYPPDEYPADET